MINIFTIPFKMLRIRFNVKKFTYYVGKVIRINNNYSLKTGYAATVDDASGSSDTSTTKPWNTTTGYLASTTGNITGVYDMSGGAWEFVMGAQVDSSGNPLSGRHNVYNSGFNGMLGCPICDSTLAGINSSITEITNGTPLPGKKYYDAYPTNSNGNRANRILGDATGEMGPFGGSASSWYSDTAWFLGSGAPWFSRGGYWGHTFGAGVFSFIGSYGETSDANSFRIVLAF